MEYCDQHSGHKANIDEVCRFKHKMDGGEHGMGELDRMWDAIGKKVSKSMMVTFCILIITLVSTLFGLVYHSNSKVLHEMVDLKANISIIMETIK